MFLHYYVINIVKKFTKDTNTYLIMIKENVTFLSRNDARELLQDEIIVNEFVKEASSVLKNSQVIDQTVMTIDTYPTVQFTAKGKMERSGVTVEIIMKWWAVFYEDKIVFLQSGGIDNAEFKALEQLYFLVSNSLIFPDQYN